MIKTKICFKRQTKTMWLLAMLLLTCSCGEDFSTLETTDKEGGIPLQLSVSMDNSGFSSDSEVIPMGTRAEKELPYVVTRLLYSTLYILKEVGDDQWVAMERKEIIDIPESQSLTKGEKLTLKDNNYVLLPGTYRFLLFVNALIDDIPLGEILDKNCKGTSTSNPRSDFYFAEDTITLKKTEQLDKESNYEMHLSLKRRSALLRYIIVGPKETWNLYDNATIKFSIEGNKVCTGMNILGEDKIGDLSIDKSIDINIKTMYDMAEEKWAFSSTYVSNTLVSLYTLDKESHININITEIRNEQDGSPFKGNCLIENVPIQRNHITTILIRKTGKNEIECKVNPSTKGWDDSYPPLNYIELNNK